MKPSYLALHKSGELARRIGVLASFYRKCTLCPHQCGVDRTDSQVGRCRSGSMPSVASANVHRGEEPPISGENGSGTIFFAGCTGSCMFCQNYPISQLGTGTVVSETRLAEMMLNLERQGCHNINFVTPTHFVPSLVAALGIAVENGFSLPLVYNSSGYERVEVLKLLEGIVDVYLPDIKYADDAVALRLSGFHEYTRYNRAAIREMHRQVGNLRTSRGIAVKGVIVRHLILPDNLAGTEDSMQFLASLSKNMRVSLMEQYFPAYLAVHDEILSRRINEREYGEAVDAFHRQGLRKGWIQEQSES